MATALLAATPEFADAFRMFSNGSEFETSFPAPSGSHAGAIVVTTDREDTWIHLAPPQMWYLT